MIETVQSAPAIGSLAVQDLPPEELRTIRLAAERLRRSRGVVVRAADLLAGILGPVASLGLRQLSVSPALIGKVQGVAEAALRRAFDVAIVGVAAERRSRFGLGDRGSRWFAAASGAVTGFTGIAGFLPDVTVVTLLIMRRIAMIAVEEGEDLSTPEARAACLEVFALDLAGPSDGRPERAETELRYWTARFVLQGRPLVLLLSEVAATYGVRLSQKLALQAVPLVGAAGAAVVNNVFMDHYQTLAHVHFTIRRLERTYGSSAVRKAWLEIGNG